MAFNLGAFAGGIGQGIEQGQEIKERYRKMAEEQTARRAQQAVDNWLNPPAQPNPAPGGGAPPAPLTSVAMPGAQPIPSPAGPPPGGAPAGPVAPGAGQGPPAPMPAGAAPPAPPPGAMAPPRPAGPPPGAAPPPGGGMAPPGPQGAPAAPGGLGGGLPPPGSPQNQDPLIQSKAAIQAVAKEIAQANPGRKWGKGELLDAVNDALGMMKELDPTAAKIAQLQVEWYKAQLGADTSRANTEERVGAQERGQDTRATTAANSLAERIRHEKATEQTAQGRAATYAEMASWGHEDRQTAIAAANERATQATDSREKVAAQRDADTMARLDKALEDKDWATVANITAGEYKADTTAGGKAGARPAIAPPPSRAGGGSRVEGAGGGAPPIPPTTEGMTATSPSGQKWVVRGGKWVKA